MALRKIVLEDDPILYKKSREIVDFNERLSILIDDMIETMRHAEGAGLAAVQVGVLRRVLVIEYDGQLIEVVNPEFLYQSEETICDLEGCLSFPDEQMVVRRPAKVKVAGKNRHGEAVEYEAEGFLAKAFCHEIDHLNGITFIEMALTEEEEEEWFRSLEEEDYDEDYEDENLL